MKRFFRGFVFALQGIRVAFREQLNIRIQSGIAILVVAAGFYFGITALEWCVVLLTIALVIGLEMINSAIENLVDLITRDYHPLAGKVKDIAAGAVLIAAVLAVVVGVIVFGKYL